MKITVKLTTLCKKIEPLYFVEIQEGSTIAYLTKTKLNEYTITTEYKQSWLFDNPNTIHSLDILKGLNYNLINFNDIFVPYYIVGISKENNEVEYSIRWAPINTEDINLPTYLATTNIQTAKEKLEYIKYLKIHELQQKISNICEIKISDPTVGN